MKRLQRASIILSLIEELTQRGSWCGETHLQKAIYFLQNIYNVPLDFEFILYKHGPFSFDFRDEITSLRADGLLTFCYHQYPYGPSLKPTELGYKIMEKYPKTLATYKDDIISAAEVIGNKGVAELEQLATALFITKENPQLKKIEKRAEIIHQLKPHISRKDAKQALEAIEKFL